MQITKLSALAWGERVMRGAHLIDLVEGKLLFQAPLFCGSIPFWKRLQEITLRKSQEWST